MAKNLKLRKLLIGVFKLRKEIRIAGFGGQGIILAGIVIGKAAALHDGIHHMVPKHEEVLQEQRL